ncbi:MAG TPA: ABC transporter substrate-binding protein, partial [Methylomirabilota bacterium]
MSPTVLWIAVGHVGVVLLTFAVTMAQGPPAARTDLAPTGKLRAGVNYGNFILAVKDVATGESRGVAIDLMRELAQRLGVPA